MVSCHIGSVDFFPDDYEIRVSGLREHLQPQLRNVLVCLVRHQGEVVTRDTLLREAWDGKPATDECLTRCVSLPRKHLRDKALLETIPRVGYRLHGPCPQGHTPQLGSSRTGASGTFAYTPAWFCYR